MLCPLKFSEIYRLITAKSSTMTKNEIENLSVCEREKCGWFVITHLDTNNPGEQMAQVFVEGECAIKIMATKEVE